MRRFLDLAEKGFAILGLCFFTGGLNAIFPDIVITAIRYGVWLAAFLLICFRWQNTLHTALQGRFIWVLTGFALLSFTWSEQPDFSLAMTREVLNMTIFSVYFASRFKVKEQLEIVALALALIAVISAAYAVALPSVGLHQGDAHSGAWRGIFASKNVLSRFMTLGSVACFLLTVGYREQRFLGWLGCMLCLSLIVLSTSRSGFVNVVLLTFLLLYYRNFRWRGERTVVALDLTVLVVGCLITLTLANWEPLLTSIGRDPTLTGRTHIWSGSLAELQEQPWLGFGRAVFWKSNHAIDVGTRVASGYVPPHAHNGFIDLMLELGMIGALLFLISWGTAYIASLQRAYAAKQGEDLWPLCFLTFLALYNMVESALLVGESLFWVLFVATVLSTRRD